MLDSQGNVQLWNPAAEQIFGWTAQEIIGSPYPIVPPGEQNEYARFMTRVDQGETLADFETVRPHKDGSLGAVSISSAPVQAVDGTVTGRMAIIADRKKMERSLQQRNLEMATLYATALEITALSDLSLLLKAIVQRACALLNLTSGALHLVRPEQEMLETVAGCAPRHALRSRPRAQQRGGVPLIS